MNNLFRLFILAAVLCTAVWSLSAQNGYKISIQGTLKDANSASLGDGQYDLVFRLYPTPSGGTAVWEESATVQLIGGVYNHRLGSVTPLNLFDFNASLFVGITLNSLELSPRTELTYAPYTLHTQFATRTGQGVPPGTMMPFCGPIGKMPAGYVPCDGRALSSAEYPDLFAAIGTTWGNGTQNASGGGVKDFNVPDSRGYFLRGWGGGTDSDDPDRNTRTAQLTGGATGNNVGTLQGDGLVGHNHSFSATTSGGFNSAHSHGTYEDVYISDACIINCLAKDDDGEKGVSSTTRSVSGGEHSHAISFTTSDSGGSAESRPDNVSVLFIIKL